MSVSLWKHRALSLSPFPSVKAEDHFPLSLSHTHKLSLPLPLPPFRKVEDHFHQNSLDWQRKKAAEAGKKEKKADNNTTPLTESNAKLYSIQSGCNSATTLYPASIDTSS